MPIDDFLDPAQEGRRLKKAQQRAWVSGGQAGGDSDHLGAGAFSIALGDGAEAPGSRGIAIGQGAYADGSYSIALGVTAYAASNATAVGYGANATQPSSGAFGVANATHTNSVAIQGSTSAADQVVLGGILHTVVVPGTFSNPSARHLKQNITPAPDAPNVFPELVEYEKKAAPGRRHLGHIADDLIGTDAERFVVLDDDGQPAGIAYQDLHTAQIAALLARIERLENELRERNG